MKDRDLNYIITFSIGILSSKKWEYFSFSRTYGIVTKCNNRVGHTENVGKLKNQKYLGKWLLATLLDNKTEKESRKNK